MEDDDSSSSLNRATSFSHEKVQRGVVTTTTTEDEDDDTSHSNSNNEVVLTPRPEPVSSANTTTDSFAGDVGCSPTSTGLNSTTDADVEDNSSPRSGERITTSSSSSSDGYNFEERPHSQQAEKNSSQNSSTDKDTGWNRGNPSSSFKYARPTSSSIFPPFGRVVTSSPGNHFASSSVAPVSFSTVTPNPFAVNRSPSHNSSSIFQDNSTNSRQLLGSSRSAAQYPVESKPILRPSTLLAVTGSMPGTISASALPFSAVRNPFGSPSSTSAVSSTSFYNNPFNSSFGSKQDDSAGSKTSQVFRAQSTQSQSIQSSSSNSNSGVPDPDFPDPDLEPEDDQHWPNTPPEPVQNSILRQSKLSNIHYPCTSSENSEARNLPGSLDLRRPDSSLQQPSTSTMISSEATPKNSEATPSLSSAETNDVPASSNLFQSITSSVGQAFVAQQQTPTAGPSSASDSNLNFVFGSNIEKRVIAATNSSGEGAGLPNGVSSTSSFTGTFPVAGASAGLQPTEGEGSIHSSTESEQLHFQGSSTESLRLSGGNEACFASSSTAIGERKRKFDEQEQYISTGEEDESNVLQLSCRLFVYDAGASVWVERGRGQLRLNDKVVGGQDGNGAIEHSRGSAHLLGAGREEEDFLQQRRMQSRIIVRTKGSLRLMLNTNVLSGMKVERPSEKSVRFTALDNGTIKIFTVQSTANEAEVLYSALECRVRALVALEALITETHSIQPQAIAGQAQHSSNNAIPRQSAGRGDVDSESEEENPKTGTSPPKKKRLDLPVEKKDDDDFSDSGTASPTTTTADGEPISEQNDTEDGPVAGVIFHSSGTRPTVVPSIQVDKPESWSDEED